MKIFSLKKLRMSTQNRKVEGINDLQKTKEYCKKQVNFESQGRQSNKT